MEHTNAFQTVSAIDKNIKTNTVWSEDTETITPGGTPPELWR